MPQNPILSYVTKNPAGQGVPLVTDVSGALIVSNNDGEETPVYNITAATVIKAGPGVIGRINVIAAGSAAGTVNDCATTGAAATSNEIFSIPNTVGTYALIWPTLTGIVVVPGTGQTLAVSFR